ncbi:hypothetical protein HHI36_012788 [Cryptolaemus montrouzieri]|uniref:Reverse transcriptase zinc-binding domain-containing protein n=1 Tax=Cryptolaemus montrouzieri TaxID=559131 RepID=A0ABD2NFH7_9CUCU
MSIWADELEIQESWRKAGLHDDSPECPACPCVAEDVEDIFFVCPRFNPQCDELEKILKQSVQLETLAEAMLSSELPVTLSTPLQEKWSQIFPPLKNKSKR